MAAIRGVTSVGAVSELPMLGLADQRPMLFPGAPGNTGETDHDRPVVDVFYARAGYVETLGRARRAKASRSSGPHRPGRPEVMIDETLAKTFYPNGGAVGREIRINDDTATVTAVLRQLRQYDLHADGRPAGVPARRGLGCTRRCRGRSGARSIRRRSHRRSTRPCAPRTRRSRWRTCVR
jgi:hypothetical protein